MGTSRAPRAPEGVTDAQLAALAGDMDLGQFDDRERACIDVACSVVDNLAVREDLFACVLISATVEPSSSSRWPRTTPAWRGSCRCSMSMSRATWNCYLTPMGCDRLRCTGSIRQGLYELLDVGDHAPDFDLRRTFDERVRLSELRGPVLVHFYVFDFGGV